MDIKDEINHILQNRGIVSDDVMGFDENEQMDWYSLSSISQLYLLE